MENVKEFNPNLLKQLWKDEEEKNKNEGDFNEGEQDDEGKIWLPVYANEVCGVMQGF